MDDRPDLTARDEERRRLARQLEDGLGQVLALLVEQIGAYRGARTFSAGQAGRALETLSGMAWRALGQARDVVSDLRAGDLLDLGLAGALETLALRVERRYGLAVALDLSGDVADLSPQTAMAAYRIAQEALHNVGQHAGAGRAGVSLRAARGRLALTIADDGDGFDPPEPLDARVGEDRRGLAEMATRAAAAGGQLQVSSVRGVGTQVRAELPLEGCGPEPAPGGVAGPPQSGIEPLTPREHQVLAAVAQGLTNKQIAARLGISDRTVQFHLGNVLTKLGVASRTEAAVVALERGLV